jgi:hypothetical protein
MAFAKAIVGMVDGKVYVITRRIGRGAIAVHVETR